MCWNLFLFKLCWKFKRCYLWFKLFKQLLSFVYMLNIYRYYLCIYKQLAPHHRQATVEKKCFQSPGRSTESTYQNIKFSIFVAYIYTCTSMYVHTKYTSHRFGSLSKLLGGYILNGMQMFSFEQFSPMLCCSTPF